MQKINVVDLDKTLIPYDSFGKLIKNELKKLDVYVIYINFLRFVRILSSYKFKKILTNYWRRKYDESFFQDYAKIIYRDINLTVLEIVKNKTDINTINILLSASPDLYVRYLVKKMINWEGRGSYFSKDEFIHLYSKGKINWILENYQPSKFRYSFAISDSYSDSALLEMFDEFILWEN